jgi:hypothetical protein
VRLPEGAGACVVVSVMGREHTHRAVRGRSFPLWFVTMLARGLLAFAVLARFGPCTAATEEGDEDIGVPDASADVADRTNICPGVPPAVGSSCGLPAKTSCTFGDPCHFDRYACEHGRWLIMDPDASTPPSCPAAAPATGTICASCGSTLRCAYDAACASGGAGSTVVICSGGHWLSGTTGCDGGAAPVMEGGSE